MQKRIFLLSSFLCLSFLALAQWEQVSDFNEHRYKKQRQALTVLGGWAVLNLGTGIALQGRSEGSGKYFHQMNAGWGAVNLAIAGFGYWSVLRSDPAAMSLFNSVNEHYGFQKTLLFNAGLDVGYMIGGAYLLERAKNTAPDKNPERLQGFGRSVVLQGAFLFLFDLGAYLAMRADNASLQPLLNSLSTTPDGIGLRMVF
jgi:hypothetical protein